MYHHRLRIDTSAACSTFDEASQSALQRKEIVAADVAVSLLLAADRQMAQKRATWPNWSPSTILVSWQHRSVRPLTIYRHRLRRTEQTVLVFQWPRAQDLRTWSSLIILISQTLEAVVATEGRAPERPARPSNRHRHHRHREFQR